MAPPFLALLDFAKARFTSLKLAPHWVLGLGGLIVDGVVNPVLPDLTLFSAHDPSALC